MRIAEELTTRLYDKGDEEREPTCEILISGRTTEKTIPGATLEAAVSWNDCYLLFMTDDLPYDEMLRVLQLNKELDTIDAVIIGTPYSTGSFSSLVLLPPNRIRFRFIGDTFWEIELLSNPGFRIPFISDPTGVWRAFGFSRHFVVRGSPRPQQ